MNKNNPLHEALTIFLFVGAINIYVRSAFWDLFPWFVHMSLLWLCEIALENKHKPRSFQ